MSFEQYISYTMVITILLLSPGPSVLLSINNGLKYGRKLSALGVLGNVFAFQILIIISATGLSAVIVAFDELLLVIKTIGALYLCYLGFKIYVSSASQADSNVAQTNLAHQPWKIFKQAFLITLLNPKALIFVSALLPQFINPVLELTPQVNALCFITALIHFSIYFGYAMLAARAKPMINKGKNQDRFNKISGITFLIFGLTLGISAI